MSDRRLLTVLVVTALIGATIPAAVGVGAAVDSGDGDVSVTQKNDGGLTVELDNETFSQNLSSTVDVTVAGEQLSLENGTSFNEPDRWGWEVPRSDLPDGALGDARVLVTYNGTEEFNQTMDLRHLAVDPATAQFDGEGRLAMNVTASVGLGDGPVELRALPNEGEAVTMEGSIDGSDVLRFDRGQFESLLLPPSNVTLSAADAGPQLVADGRIDFRDMAEPSASLQRDGVLVASPLLVEGEQYQVTLATDDPEGTYVVATNASDGEIGLTNEYVTSAGTVTVTFDGESTEGVVVEAEFAPETLAGAVENGTVGITEGELPDGTLDRAILEDESGVTLLENVSVQSGELSLPVNVTGDGGSLLLLYGDGSTVLVDLTGGQAAPDTGNETPTNATNATNATNESGGLPVTGGSSLPVVVGILFVLLFGVVLVYFWRSSDDGGASGGAGARQLSVSVVDGSNGSQITDPVSVRVAPKHQRTKEGFQRNPTGRSYEVTGGEAEIEVSKETVEIEATYNGVTSTTVVGLAESDDVNLAIGPVTRTLTVQDEDGNPIGGATVSIESGGQTQLSQHTGEDGQTQFSISADATRFDVVVDHDRFEQVSRSVSDPSTFPESITLVEKTGTLRVRTAVNGESTDVVDLRIAAGEGTRSDAAPVVDEPVEPGIYQFDDVQVGTYELVATVDGSQFEPDRRTVDVGADESVTVELDVGFQFSIAGYRDEVAALRRAADGLAPSSQIDTAIHEYYASVGHSLADVVESLPERGDMFAATGVDPDTMAEELLEAGQDVVSAVENALNRKQNVDLFNANSNLPSVNVQWDGFDIEELFELAEKDRLDQHGAIRQRINDLEDRVESEREKGNAVSPASDVLDELRDYARQTSESAAVAFVILGFADAIEDLFDHPQLRERL